MTKIFRTAAKSDGWTVSKGNSSHSMSVFVDQASAWHEAKRLARGAGGEALLHDREGKISTRNSYVREQNLRKG